MAKTKIERRLKNRKKREHAALQARVVKHCAILWLSQLRPIIEELESGKTSVEDFCSQYREMEDGFEALLLESVDKSFEQEKTD